MINTSLIFSVLLHINGTATYDKDIKPILKARCNRCHARMGARSDWMNYDTAFKARHKIWSRVVIQKNMPPGGGDLTSKERNMIKKWIEQGAKK